jgi:uncharacterized protein YodC (DUF2158 family)
MGRESGVSKEIEKGDVVRLKSGGPCMTVMYFDIRGQAVCQWFVGEEAKSGVFAKESLVQTQNKPN